MNEEEKSDIKYSETVCSEIKYSETQHCSGCCISYAESKEFSEEQVINFYITHNVVRKFRKCPRCKQILNPNSRKMFTCHGRFFNQLTQNSERCYFIRSIWNLTFLHRKRIHFCTFFHVTCAILCVSPPRQDWICQKFHIGYRTVIHMNLRLREVFTVAVSENTERLGGNGQIVQLEHGRWSSKAPKEPWNWVFGAIDYSSRCTFLVPVKCRDASTVKDLILQKINPGTILVYSCFKDYELKDYKDLTENHNISLVKTCDSELYSDIKRHWNEVRRGELFPKTYQRPVNSVDQLAEYLFKSKYPQETQRIHAFFEAAGKLYPPPK